MSKYELIVSAGYQRVWDIYNQTFEAFRVMIQGKMGVKFHGSEDEE